ncbi:MAG: mechanosensitive ion channel [Oscillatoriales cyanobacterium C42_A2020_001]|nr:mechanosensitive ion channel [Leptolyngbyaceae cyanobacterium C42_A2020_001]
MSHLLGVFTAQVQVGNPALPESLGIPPTVFNVVMSLIGAIAILLLGWVVAALVSSTVRNLLKRTDLDNRIVGMTAGQQAPGINIEKIIATVVFWIIMILAIVAALNVLNLTTVSQPLNGFLNQIFSYLPRLGGAALLILAAWILATISRLLVIRLARSLALDERVMGEPEDELAPPQNQFLLSDTLGNVLYWFIFLFFLPLILGVLNLQGPLTPVQNLLNEFLAALPNIFKAIVIGFAGWLIARVVREIVRNLLVAVGTDRFGNRIGLTRSTSQQPLSWIIATIVYVLILIPTAIAALEALQIRSISLPAAAMLNQILAAIPQIFTAAVILVLGYVVGQLVKDLVTNLLTGLGFNNVLSWLGLRTETTPLPPPPPVEPLDPDRPLLIEPDSGLPSARTPSEVVGIVAMVGIILLAAVAATNVLGIPALTAIVGGLLVLLGQVLVGLAIFAVGLYLANLAYSIISTGSAQSKILAQTARIAILALVIAMALQQIGLAPNIINLAFGLLLGAISVAIALAFGLGGRDVAAEQLREWLANFKRRE